MSLLTPSFESFRQLAQSYNVIPLSRSVVMDRATPVSVYERLSKKEPYSFLLESVEGEEHVGRYSFVGRRPQAVFRVQNGQVTYQQGKTKKTWKSANPVDDLKNTMGRLRAPVLPEMPRFWGGAVGYWDYDTVRYFEKLPTKKPDLMGVPQAAFQLSGDLVIFDRFTHTAQVIRNVLIPEGQTGDAALKRLYQAGMKAVDAQIRDIERSMAPSKAKVKAKTVIPKPLVKKQDYLHAVEKAKDYIRAGDIIQVVLSQRWELEPKAAPFQIYRSLRLLNPSPYMYYLHFPDLEIVGSSPELLVRKEGTLVETRPIAGTRRRGKTDSEDVALAEELKADPKERAEHLMLVDLGRNDLGRVCEPGSVKVENFMSIERYSHVMHIVSTVLGRIAERFNAFDLLKACFPAGTLSGAPKVRAMQIIDELESFRRGPYGGALGYFSYTGNMDLAITIRTLVFSKGKAYLQAGAGIVADSDPEREFKECEQKAAALIAAVEKAGELS